MFLNPPINTTKPIPPKMIKNIIGNSIVTPVANVDREANGFASVPKMSNPAPQNEDIDINTAANSPSQNEFV